MLADPWGPPPATMCDPHRHRDLVPGWSCEVPGCDCGSTPSLLKNPPGCVVALKVDSEFAQDLREELLHIYELAALEREAEEVAREAKALRDPWWFRALRWLVA